MTTDAFAFASQLVEWEAKPSYVLLGVPPDVAEDIRLSGAMPAGFGSFKVEAAIGATSWQTSVFPDTGTGGFVLPVKKAVRVAEGIEVGDRVEVSLRVLA